MNDLSPLTRTMTAAVLKAPRTLELVEVPVPEPGPGQVRVKLEGCGVCASNLTPWAGPDWMEFPTEPGGLGHEGWGVIDAVGADVTGVKPGDRVAAISHHSYAGYDIAAVDAVVPLPPELDGQPFPGEPLGCALNIFRRSEIRADQWVAIVGIGFLGALLTQLAASAGAKVIAISRRRYALDMAGQMGASHLLPLDEPDRIVQKVEEITGGALCDRVIEAAGKQAPLELAARLAKVRGRLIIAGYHQDGPRTVDMQLWNWRGLDVINAHERDPARYVEGVKFAIREVVSGRLDPMPLYTHRYPLGELDKALDATRDRPHGFLKALVMLS